MIECKKAISLIERALKGVDDNEGFQMDLNDLVDILETVKALSEEKDVRRYEIQAQGRVSEIQYINNKGEDGDGLIKFLFEKAKKDSSGEWVSGAISCIVQEGHVKEKIENGDRIFIKGDFSPYEVERNGKIIHKIKIWVDEVALVKDTSKKYITHAERKLM